MKKTDELKKKLTYKRKNFWNEATVKEQKTALDFSEGYKNFLDECKTERESIEFYVKELEKCTNYLESQIAEQKTNEWISVEDELPKDGIKVIFQTKHYLEFPDNVYTGVKWGHKMHFSQQRPLDFGHVYMENVTHWKYVEPQTLEPKEGKKANK